MVSKLILIFYPSPIPDPGVKKEPDPGVKKEPDPGSGSATLDTRFKKMNDKQLGNDSEGARQRL